MTFDPTKPIQIGTHSGAPVSADGTFKLGYGWLDTNDNLYVCTNETTQTFVQMTGSAPGNAAVGDVASGKTFSSANGLDLTGTYSPPNGFFLAPSGIAYPYTGGDSTQPLSVPVTTLSGLPLLLVECNASGDTATGITDNFPNPYTWTEIDTGTAGGRQSVWIGTGGSGTFGTLSVAYNANVSQPSVYVYPCVGAASGSGLAIIDAYNVSTGTSTTPTGPSLTTTSPNEMALYVASWSGANINANGLPSSPWASSILSEASSNPELSMIAIYQNIPTGTVLAPTWSVSASISWDVIGVVIKS